MGKTIAEHARDVLIETDNYGVGYGDSGLLESIAVRCGYQRKQRRLRSAQAFGRSIHNRWDSVLSGIARRPDLFERRRGFKHERVFWLRECIVNGKPEMPNKLGLKAERENE